MKEPKSLYLKVPKKIAEDTRRKLIETGVFDNTRETEPVNDSIVFPVKNKLALPGGKAILHAGRKRLIKPRSLKQALGGQDDTPTSYDVVGDIAIIEFSQDFPGDKEKVGKALIDTFPNIKVVVEKSAKVSGEYRVRGIAHLAGEKRTETVHKEFGCHYKLDVASAYFSPRLGTERMRVAGQVAEGERVLVLFAGVGPYAVLIAKKRNPGEVIAVELNEKACEYMDYNVARNRVNVKVVCGDAKKETPKLGKFNRIIMPLPLDAADFLDVALPALKKEGVIHFYMFARDENEAIEYLSKKIEVLSKKIDILSTTLCGSYSPCLSRYCVDFKANKPII